MIVLNTTMNWKEATLHVLQYRASHTLRAFIKSLATVSKISIIFIHFSFALFYPNPYFHFWDSLLLIHPITCFAFYCFLDTCIKNDYFIIALSYKMFSCMMMVYLRNWCFWLSKNLRVFNPLMHNVPKWSDTLLKSCSICCKILKVCLTILWQCEVKSNMVIF